MKLPILMTEEYWRNSQFSIVKHFGKIQVGNLEFIIVNKEGKDIFECSLEAQREGREKAIPAGEPCDLVDVRYTKIYRAVGREKFIEWIKEGLELKRMEKRLKEMQK